MLSVLSVLYTNIWFLYIKNICIKLNYVFDIV